MTLLEQGEFGFIKDLQQRFLQPSKKFEVGIGDDCSVIPFDEKYFQLTTTDLLLEGVHFLIDEIGPYNLGRKALMVNLSDIAAMGGAPKQFYLSLGLPSQIKKSFVDLFFDGIYSVAEEFQIKLMGGDTTRSQSGVVINISIQGLVTKKNLKLRSTAKEGDLIILNSPIGNSAMGLEILLNKTKTSHSSYFLDQHHNPKAHINEGLFLSKWKEVHAMMDVSDGLSSDLNHICLQSGLGARVDLSQIPLSPQYMESCQQNQQDPYQKALCGGEDYCLLMTIKKDFFEQIAQAYKKEFGSPLIAIGEMNSGQGTQYWLGDRLCKSTYSGFDHFATNSSYLKGSS